MSRPTDDIEWGTDGAAEITEPSSGVKEVGWVHGKKPPASWTNWFWRAYWRWITFIDGVLNGDSHNTAAITADSTATRPALTLVGDNLFGALAIDVKNANGTVVGLAIASSDFSLSRGIEITGGASLKVVDAGINCTTGNAAGISCSHSGSSGNAVSGNASAAGSVGVAATNNAGVALSIDGDSTSPVKAAVFWGPQDAEPTGAHLVGHMYVTSAGVLKICTTAGTPGTWTSVGAQT